MSTGKSIFCQITSGRGPAEVTRAVVLVLKKLTEDIESKDAVWKMIEHTEGQHPGTLYSCIISISAAEDIISALKEDWEGTVQWISTKNPYRPHHGRTRWSTGVHFFTFPEKAQFDVNDVKFETTRASGPGGQNVNKVETAVRATHIPSGLSVLANDERSQSQNKVLAIERLKAKLAAIEEAKEHNQTYEIWMNHNLLQRGNPVKVFKGEL